MNFLALSVLNVRLFRDFFKSPVWSEWGSLVAFSRLYFSHYVSGVADVLQCRSQLKGWRTLRVVPSVLWRTFQNPVWHITVFYKRENCRCRLKVVAGEIRPVHVSLHDWLGKCLFFFKLNPLESNHFFSFSFFFGGGGQSNQMLRHQLLC